jgi:hypothetical protein
MIIKFLASSVALFASLIGKFRKPAVKTPFVIASYPPDAPESILDRVRMHGGDDVESPSQSDRRDAERAARSVC